MFNEPSDNIMAGADVLICSGFQCMKICPQHVLDLLHGAFSTPIARALAHSAPFWDHVHNRLGRPSIAFSSRSFESFGDHGADRRFLVILVHDLSDS